MSSSTDKLGPLAPVFHKNVGVYMRNSPSPADKACLRAFFEDLRTVGAHCTHQMILDDIIIVHVCNHVIRFVGKGRLVENISRGIT